MDTTCSIHVQQLGYSVSHHTVEHKFFSKSIISWTICVDMGLPGPISTIEMGLLP